MLFIDVSVMFCLCLSQLHFFSVNALELIQRLPVVVKYMII